MIVIKNLEEMQSYYNKETNIYFFDDYVEFKFSLKVEANIDAVKIEALDIKVLNVKVGDINAWNIDVANIKADKIEALDIKAKNIDACEIKVDGNIEALDINAWNIDVVNIKTEKIEAFNIISNNIEAKHILYGAVCYAKNNIVCETIKGKHQNSKHFVLNGKIEVAGEGKR